MLLRRSQHMLAQDVLEACAYRVVAGSLPMWLQLFLAASFGTA
jgi:hypothetical protein